MLQRGDRVEFSFWEAGCMIWVGAWEAYQPFCQAWNLIEAGRFAGMDHEKIRQLILQDHAIMPLSLYQDDGYYTRVVFGDLNSREQEDWTARAQWQLMLPSGKLVISGIVDEDEEVPALAEAVPHDTLQLYIEVPPGQYVVTLYAYPPGDLSTGWGQIKHIDNGLFAPTPGIEPENPLTYFQRTRPNEAIPDWLGADYAPTEAERKHYFEAFYAGNEYVNFVVQLVPFTDTLPIPPTPNLEADGCISWEFRKPDRCPLGVRALYPVQ